MKYFLYLSLYHPKDSRSATTNFLMYMSPGLVLLGLEASECLLLLFFEIPLLSYE